MIVAWILLIVVLAFVGKLIYDVQENKNKINEINETAITEAEKFREQWQTIAGIKPTNPNDELREILVKNNILAKEQIVGELLKAAQNSEFPAPDESINVRTTKIGAIDMKSYGDSDPLASVPMSRVSAEGKKKMAEIAKQDISKQIEENAERLSKLQPINLDKPKKPKRKYNKKPKQ
jgi:hypothetical protein